MSFLKVLKLQNNCWWSWFDIIKSWSVSWWGFTGRPSAWVLHRSTWKLLLEWSRNQDITEGLIARVMKETKGNWSNTPFPRMNYDDAMVFLYGSDKPDTFLKCYPRLGQNPCQGWGLQSLLSLAAVKAIVVKGAADHYLVNTSINWQKLRSTWCKGLAWVNMLRVLERSCCEVLTDLDKWLDSCFYS